MVEFAKNQQNAIKKKYTIFMTSHMTLSTVSKKTSYLAIAICLFSNKIFFPSRKKRMQKKDR